MSSADPRGILFVISAPSGTGKSTVARKLLDRAPRLKFSVSYTTRPKRAGERDAKEYNFVERDRFEAMIEQNAFLEWARVFDQFYGTGREATREALAGGDNLLLDIDVQGARQVRACGEPFVSVMLLPPDYATLEARLKSRGSESAATLATRLAQARREAEDYRFFDYVVVNNNLTESVAEVESIFRAEHRRTLHCAEQVERILATFPALQGETPG